MINRGQKINVWSKPAYLQLFEGSLLIVTDSSHFIMNRTALLLEHIQERGWHHLTAFHSNVTLLQWTIFCGKKEGTGLLASSCQIKQTQKIMLEHNVLFIVSEFLCCFQFLYLCLHMRRSLNCFKLAVGKASSTLTFLFSINPITILAYT